MEELERDDSVSTSLPSAFPSLSSKTSGESGILPYKPLVHFIKLRQAIWASGGVSRDWTTSQGYGTSGAKSIAGQHHGRSMGKPGLKGPAVD